jgi:hypothetical protein
MVDLVLHKGGGEVFALQLDAVAVHVESCHANGERAANGDGQPTWVAANPAPPARSNVRHNRAARARSRSSKIVIGSARS